MTTRRKPVRESARVRELLRKYRAARDAGSREDALAALSPGVKKALRQDTLAKARSAAKAGHARKAAHYATQIPSKYYDAIDKCSKTIVNQALAVTGGNKAAAASALGITVRGLEKALRRSTRSSRRGAGRRTDLGR
jgi:transcriptional regulator with GAF, ATPase, and Fis domain